MTQLPLRRPCVPSIRIAENRKGAECHFLLQPIGRSRRFWLLQRSYRSLNRRFRTLNHLSLALNHFSATVMPLWVT
jgi:hypothetical protein